MSGGNPAPKASVKPSRPGVPGGRRFFLPSQGVLQLLRLVAVLACLVAGAAGAGVLMTTSNGLDDINNGTQQTMRLEQIKGDVLRADGLATNGLAQGSTEPLAQREQYKNALKEAAQLTVDASKAQPLDSGDLAVVNAGLVNYVATLEMGRTSYLAGAKSGLTYVDDAGKTLTSDTVPALNRLIAANQARVDQAKATDRVWSIVLALIPVILLVGISIWIARRTKRVANIGLLLALAASFLLWRLVDTNLTDTSRVVDTTRAGTLQSATAAGSGFASLAMAKSIEGRELLDPSRVATLEPTWTSTMSDVAASVAKLGGDATDTATSVASYQKSHADVVELLKAGKLAEARTSAGNTTTGVNPAYAKAADSLSAAFTTARDGTASEMTTQKDGLRIGAILAGLLGAAGAVAAAVGITQRLREYR